ncbi:hypothetical protein ACE02D_14795 [Shewanella bicestrii]
MQKGVCVKDLLLTKSDDWIYEKEHRILPKLRDADFVRVDRILFEQLHDFYDDLYIRLFRVISEDDNFITFQVNPDEYERFDNQEYDGNSTDDNEEMKFSPSETILNEIYGSLAVMPSSVFLFQLPVDCISAVFLGCRTSPTDIAEIKDLVKNKNIPTFQAELSKTHFSLSFNEV